MKCAHTFTCTIGFIMSKHVSWSFYLVVFFFLQKSKKTEQCFGIYFEPTDEVQLKILRPRVKYLPLSSGMNIPNRKVMNKAAIAQSEKSSCMCFCNYTLIPVDAAKFCTLGLQNTCFKGEKTSLAVWGIYLWSCACNTLAWIKWTNRPKLFSNSVK